MFNFDNFHSNWYKEKREEINKKYKRVTKISTDKNLSDKEKNSLLANEDYLALKGDWDKVGEDFQTVLGRPIDKK